MKEIQDVGSLVLFKHICFKGIATKDDWEASKNENRLVRQLNIIM